MRGVPYRTDGDHVDEAGTLIGCTSVDLRHPAERRPLGRLKKASSTHHAIPGGETVRISKPSGGGGHEGRRGARVAEPSGEQRFHGAPLRHP